MNSEISVPELESYLKQNINALKESNIVIRKKAAQNIYDKIIDPNIAQSEVLSQQILLKHSKELMKSLSDSSEKVRELCSLSLKQLIEQCEDSEPILPCLFAVLVDRSNCTDLEGIQHLPEVMRPPPSQLPTVLIKLIETSEEVRLKLVELMTVVLSKHNSDILHEYIDDIVDILRAFLMDPFGDIQKQACKALKIFCDENYKMLLHFTEKMSRAVLFPLISKKSPIRISALNALSSILKCGVWKHNATVFEILTGFRDPNSVPIKAFYEPMHNVNYLATLIIDPKQQVREVFIQQVGFWLTKLDDRWDHHARLVPYLLSGLFDEDSHIQEASIQIIDEVGLQWEVEREKDIKDQKQLGVDSPWTLGGNQKIINLPQEPPLKSRPRLGSRGFIRSQVRKMWPALYKEIVDSNEESRTRASKLIIYGVIYSEEYMTQFLDNFVPNMITAIKYAQTQNNQKILLNLGKVFYYIGRYCEPKSYLLMIFQSLRGNYIRDENYMKCAIVALNNLCQGAFSTSLDGLGEKIKMFEQIIELLNEPEQIEYISSLNLNEINNLVLQLSQEVQQKGTQQEQIQFNEKYSKQLISINNVITYIENFNTILLNQSLKLEHRIKPNQSNQMGEQENVIFGNYKWRILIMDIVNAFYNVQQPKWQLDQLQNIADNSEIPECPDFLIKLSHLLTYDTKTQEQLGIILRIISISFQWLNRQSQPSKVLDFIFQAIINLSKQLNIKQLRDVGKQLKDNAFALQNYTQILLQYFQFNWRLFRKQLDNTAIIARQLIDLILPYPSSRLLVDTNKNYLIAHLSKYVIDCIDVLGENPKIETRLSVFHMLSIVHQFIPSSEELFIGSIYTIPDFPAYLRLLIKYAIEEKDLQTQDLYVIQLRELQKRTPYNFQIELEQAKNSNQLTRIQFLQNILR
ncbi:hypothetical protein pb186bvf_002577 [Paramecium bursaria]